MVDLNILFVDLEVDNVFVMMVNFDYVLLKFVVDASIVVDDENDVDEEE